MRQQGAREPTAEERRLLEFLLSRDFPGRTQLAIQLQHTAIVEEYMDGGAFIRLAVDRAQTPKAPVVRRVPVEAFKIEQSIVQLEVLLHVVDGYLSVLEVVPRDPTYLGLPDISELQLFSLDV